MIEFLQRTALNGLVIAALALALLGLITLVAKSDNPTYGFFLIVVPLSLFAGMGASALLRRNTHPAKLDNIITPPKGTVTGKGEHSLEISGKKFPIKSVAERHQALFDSLEVGEEVTITIKNGHLVNIHRHFKVST